MSQRSAAQTKALIIQEFLHLVETGHKPPKVADLCRAAGISRSTFYFYYQDATAVLDELEDDFLAHTPFMLFSGNREALRSQLQESIAYGHANRRVFCVLYEQGRLTDKVLDKSERFMAMRAGSDSPTQGLVTAYCCTGTYRVVYDWLSKGLALSEDQVVGILLELLVNANRANRALTSQEV